MIYVIIYIYMDRFEAFNSFIRSQNVFANRLAPSRDIAHKLAVIEYLRYLCSSNSYVQIPVYTCILVTLLYLI